MKRRDFLAVTAAAALARPGLAQGSRVLRFVPQGNLNNPDPVWTTTTLARNHGLMIWDTLYAVNGKLEPQPQMVEGHEILDDGKTWRFTLRQGLAFHDGEPVRGTDCIASIQRWGKRRGLGQRMLEQTDEMRPVSDRVFEIRMKKPYPLMPTALADWCFVMPERVAKTSPFEQITDYTGSGPFRFVRDEWVSGSQAVYARNDKYVPRQEPPDGAAGGKVVNFDRVEWRIVPDQATAAAALQSNEVDWVEQPLFDLLPTLRKARGVRVMRNDTVGAIAMVAVNHLHPPFKNPKLRRALLPAIDQQEFMQAAYGEEQDLYRTGVGVFTPGLPMATTAGLEALTGKRDLALAKKLVAESGYGGEKVLLMSPSDYADQQAYSQVFRDLLQKVGVAVEYLSMDWGTLVQRRASREPGVWNSFCTTYEGMTVANPASHLPLRGNGLEGWFGWPTDPAMEALRDQWFDAPDLAAQRQICDQMQRLAFEHVPFYPIGQRFLPTAVRDHLQDMVKASYPVFWGVRRA
ncbi:MAG TPA: ABC transporter substrate-binding protein [Acetobacteraceae bacterium]|nr:ABC transporter substrate-binding protein [Acetobacteraceae bacterium]